MQTSGLVLDVYDDHDGAVLKEVYPTFAEIPGIVKEAHELSAEDRRGLPDDVFALILLNNGESLRKYACVDPGGTKLSVEYFLKTAHKLPVEAQKVAAQNLITACSWYGLKVPTALEKTAGIIGGLIGTGLSLANTAGTVVGTAQGVKNNLKNVGAAERAGMGIVSPGKLASAKTAEVNGTDLAPNQPPGSLKAGPPPKTVIPKTASIGRLVRGGHGPDVEPDLVHPPTHEQKPAHPQAGHLQPKVDVSGAEPPVHRTEKKGSIFALPSEEKYPLDTYLQVKIADAWFGQYANHFTPAKRREFAHNFMKRASELNHKPQNKDIQKYGSDTFAPEAEIKAAFDARRLEIAYNDDALQLLGEVEKVARTRIWHDADTLVHMSPEQVCNVVEEFDKVAGINYAYDRTVPDPYYSIYGVEKTAEKDESAWSDQIGNDMVTSEDLRRLAQIGAFSVKTTFGGEFQEEFLKDPVGMYESLPRTQKKMLMRMANSTQPGVERTYY